jgi:hypothetical protein
VKKYILFVAMFCSLSVMADGVEDLIGQIDVDFGDTAPSVGGASCPRFSDTDAERVVDAFVRKISEVANEYQYYIVGAVVAAASGAAGVWYYRRQATVPAIRAGSLGFSISREGSPAPRGN